MRFLEQILFIGRSGAPLNQSRVMTESRLNLQFVPKKRESYSRVSVNGLN